MARLAAGLRQHGDDVAQGLLDLGAEIAAHQLASAVQPIWPAMKTWRPSAAMPLA